MGVHVVASGSQGQNDAGETLRVLLDALSELAIARRLEDVQLTVETGARRLLRADGSSLLSPDAPLANGLLGNPAPVVVDDVDADRRLSRETYPQAARTLLIVPVRRADPLAAIEVHWSVKHQVTDDEIALTQALADSCAVAIEYIRLLAELAATVEISSTDELTGIANRRAWDRALRAALEIGQSVTMMLVDLDRFKQFNDSYGHQAGDDLLRKCARSWSGALRETDLLARYGGEEFAILLPDVSLDRACQVADRVRLATPQPVTASVGLAHSLPLESVSALTARADAALYRSKRDGRDRVSVAD